MQYHEENCGHWERPDASETQSCDWKDICGLIERAGKQLKQLGIAIDIEKLADRRCGSCGCTCGGGDYGVTKLFKNLDAALMPFGYEIADYETGGDFYVWQIVPRDGRGCLVLPDAANHPADDPDLLDID